MLLKNALVDLNKHYQVLEKLLINNNYMNK